MSFVHKAYFQYLPQTRLKLMQNSYQTLRISTSASYKVSEPSCPNKVSEFITFTLKTSPLPQVPLSVGFPPLKNEAINACRRHRSQLLLVAIHCFITEILGTGHCG